MYISLVGRPTVIINSVSVASDLLDKRGSIYSDRPQMPSFELIGYANMLPFVKYGDRSREHRRMISQVIGSHSLVEQFALLQERATHAFLGRLMAHPEGLLDHINK